jgi:ATP-binding cassette subfamily F protein 3
MGSLKPKKGNCVVNGRLRIGHFTQHSADKFDLQLSAVENMMALFKDAEDQPMRSFVGKFQIQGVDAVKPMFLLSGGQKSRVAFASLAYQKPHVIMDERKFPLLMLISYFVVKPELTTPHHSYKSSGYGKYRCSCGSY